RQLAARGVFPAEEIEHARAEPLPAARRRPPFAAPHLAELVVHQITDRTRIRTSLDADLQQIAEEQAARRGQVNGAVARRSPGSTLKPFLYLMALDQGRVIPDSWLLDVPTDFSGYVAENYDERYRGVVTVRDALIQSLNASAVRLLAEIGLPEFHRLLLRGGLETLDRPAETYGLPLVLGAGEVRLVDLANLYATLAEGGVHRPLRWIEALPPDPHPLTPSPTRTHTRPGEGEPDS